MLKFILLILLIPLFAAEPAVADSQVPVQAFSAGLAKGGCASYKDVALLLDSTDVTNRSRGHACLGALNALTASDRSARPCEAINRLVGRPDDLAIIATVDRVHQCTGKLLVWEATYQHGGELVPAHYEYAPAR